VVIPGTRAREFPAGSFALPCGLIIGHRTQATDDKVRLNEMLRDFGSSMG
jgi:2,3,4,5-tetrahydropyridine-2-carboxylate N-succinyltransferase